MWGQKAPSKHENGKKRQNHKVGAEAPAQIRAEKSVGKSAVKMKWGKKRRQNSKVTAKSATTQISRKSHGGGKCHQNGKVVAENATKTVK